MNHLIWMYIPSD
uniref:Uncharacterized protein n=1 Tax=Anguilla anguilla TaxID=7936 RepID=A0A0E9W1E7_ANGAN